MQSQLEWSVLEGDEEEWLQRAGSPETAAASNGLPVYRDVPQRRSFTRRAVVIAAGVLLLVTILGFGAWYMAEQGIDRMEQEVANVVKLDTIHSHIERPQLRVQSAIQAVEFLDGNAMVQAMMTRTLPSGQPLVYLQTQFYTQTPYGWQRAAPMAAFWGPSQELYTPNLHFVFRRADRAAVERLAPELEALYTALRRALVQDLSAANDRLTVEIVPVRVYPDEQFTTGLMRLPSPLLYEWSYGYTAADLLGRLTRHALVAEMMDQTLRTLLIKEQWQPLAGKLRAWLHYTDALPLAPAAGTNPLPVTPAALAMRLADLLGCSRCPDPGIAIGMYGKKELAATQSLFNFIVATYGLDTLPVLLAGFARYDNWDTLSPAVFGVSADELETAWHAWMMPNMTNSLRHAKLGVSFTN